MPTFFVCPVCGFPGLTAPPRSATGGGSDEICPSCGFQFGYDDDDRGIGFKEWRQEWAKRGMSWSSKGIPCPGGWDPAAQLRNLR